MMLSELDTAIAAGLDGTPAKNEILAKWYPGHLHTYLEHHHDVEEKIIFPW
jgi:hypothetical protein